MLLPALWDFADCHTEAISIPGYRCWFSTSDSPLRWQLSSLFLYRSAVSTAEKSFGLRNAPRDMSWFCKEAQKWLVRGAEAMAFHLTFVSGADKALTALADQDFPSYTCCHSCIRVFVLIIQRVRIRSCQSMISRAGFFFVTFTVL